MNIKVPKFDSVGSLLLFSIFMSFTIETIVGQTSSSSLLKVIKYVLMIIPILFSIIEILLNKQKKYIFKSQINLGVFMVVILFVLSIYFSVLQRRFSFESILELIQMFFPFIISYLLINFINEDSIILFMKYALIITIIGYIIYEFSNGINLFSVSNYLKINIISSYSPFENDTFAEVASALAAFFIYYRKKMPIYCIISLLLNFLIFKRVLLLMTILLFIVSMCHFENKELPRPFFIINCILWIAIIFFVYHVYLNSTYQNGSIRNVLAELTVTRIYRFWYVIEQHFKSFGLGSTSVFLLERNISYVGVNFEMDFIRIMFELGPFAIVVIVYTYLKIAKNNLYNMIIINFCFLNLLMANGILNYWGYSIRFITILLILKKSLPLKDQLDGKKKIRLTFRRI